MPVCKTCQGGGTVYPIITQECSFCCNHPVGKKACYECWGAGWTKIPVASLCSGCGGTGKR